MTAATAHLLIDALAIPAGKRLSGRPQPLFGAEVLALPASMLFELPDPPRLGLHVPGVEGIVRVGESAAISFDEAEWNVLVCATEADRVWPRDFALFCRLKADSGNPLEAVDALAGAQPDPTVSWTVGDVLERVGATLLSVDLG